MVERAGMLTSVLPLVLSDLTYPNRNALAAFRRSMPNGDGVFSEWKRFLREANAIGCGKHPR